MAREMKDSGIAWIGEIPREWTYGKCKTILTANDGGVWGNDPVGNDFDKIVIRSTEQTIDGKWCINNPATRDLSSIDCSKARIEKNDLLITKSSGSDLHIGKTTIADDYFLKHECYFSNFIQRIRCKGYLPKLLWYLFNSSIIREQCVYLQNTTSGIGNINAKIIDNLFVPIPSLDEQRRIADFLDAECSRIDAVIEKTRASIEEYKKLKQSAITQAVTKGIRPGRKMKDSGIEWIGEIPEEWSIQRIKNIAQINGRIGFRGYTTEDLVAEGEGPITLSPSNIKEMRLVYEKCSYITWDKYEESPEIQVENGDVLFVKTGSSYGKSGYVANLPMEATINPQLVVFKRIKLDSRYFLYYLQTPSIHNEIEGVVSGGTIPTMAQEKMKNFHVCAPHDYEQKEIADYLDSYTKRIDNMVQRKEKILSELDSYKKSLIFEYVTGKKEAPIS